MLSYQPHTDNHGAHLHLALLIKDMVGIWSTAVVDSANCRKQPRVALGTVSKSVHVDNPQEAPLLLTDAFHLVELGVARSRVEEHQRRLSRIC